MFKQVGVAAQGVIQNKVVSAAAGAATGFAMFMEYLPAIGGALVSLATVIWIGIQAYYFIKEKRGK